MPRIPAQRLSSEPAAASSATTHKANLTLIERPDTWVSWCECGWEYEGSWDLVFRERAGHVGVR